LSPNDTYPQHVVTAVVVAHDGAAWLPHVIEALLGQTRPVQRVVAVDTGSRDRSGAVLASQLGQAVVFGMERGTGYAAAVTRALHHRAANVPVPGPSGVPGSGRTEWIWLLHDDCEPAPDALEQLLHGAAEVKSAAVLGPKIMDWADRQVILEAGVTIDTVGRRITGIELREVDQGQHDGDRDSLAVGSAGMLVRRDVWDEVGGFDTAMSLFREDVDFCWRVHAAGYRVRVITSAVAYHLEASARRRRTVSVSSRPHRLDRGNALRTLLTNLPAGPMLASLAGNVAVSALRTVFFLIAKRPAAALDELAACGSVLGHPLRLLRARGRRSRGRRAAYGRLRPELPPGRSVRRLAEFAADVLSRSTQLDTAGSHHASEDPSEDDSMLVDNGLTQRILTNPGVLLFAGLTVVALVAGRSLLGSGTLSGGALIPASGGAAGLWQTYLQGFHPAGIGSATSAPPYLAVLAAVATILGGKPWLAVDVILLGCVPLAGLTAYFAARRITRFAPVRVWAAGAYALLPVAMGSVAGGRIGTVVVFVLLPLIAVVAARMFTRPPRQARRAAWATGLIVALATAFVPLVWVIALIAAGLAAVAFSSSRRGMALNLAIAALVAPVLLVPWTIQVATHPSLLLLEAGVQAPGLASPDLPARSLMLLSPGGPGMPPIWVTAGLAVAALAALLLSKRRVLVTAGWGVALSGLLIAIAVSRITVTPPGADSSVPAWPGVALTVVAVGLLLAAATGGDAIPGLLAGRPGGLRALRSVRSLCVILLAAAACSAPVLAASAWVISGIRGPVATAGGQLVPELVSVSSDNGLRLRTLVLRAEPGQVSYAVLRGAAPSLADPELAPVPGTARALAEAVATLVAPNGGDAADQGHTLAQFDIGFVLMPAPVNPALARVLDGVTGLRPVSSTSSFALWRLVDFPARVRVVEPDGTIVPLRSGAVDVAGAAVPAAGGTIELAEPAGGWSATLNGHPLTSVPSPAGPWAQAFRLPRGGGLLSISHDNTGHDAALFVQLAAFAAVAVLALPGVSSAAAGAPAAAAAGATGDGSGAAEPGGAADPAGPAGPAGQAGPGRRGRGGARGRDKGRAGRAGKAARRPAGDQEGPRRTRRSLPAGDPALRNAAGRGAASRIPAGRGAASLDAAGRAGPPGGHLPPPGSPVSSPSAWPVSQHRAWPASQPPPGPGTRPASPRGGQPPPGPDRRPASWAPAEHQPLPGDQAASWAADDQTSWPGGQTSSGREEQRAPRPEGEPPPAPGYQAASWPADDQASWQGGRPAPWPGEQRASRPEGEPPPAPGYQAASWPADDQASWQGGRPAPWPGEQRASRPEGQPPPAPGQHPPARPYRPHGQPPSPPGRQPAPAARPLASWPSGSDRLDPLPAPGVSGPAWAPPEAEEDIASHWPAPGDDRGDDHW
jgi:GT2 family glycosyltransferase